MERKNGPKCPQYPKSQKYAIILQELINNSMKSPLNQILTNYLNEYHIEYLSLEEIPQFKEEFCQFLLKQNSITRDNVNESFKRWCNQLSKGRAFPDARRFAVYILWFHCELKQYQIAHLLGVSTRTIRRDMSKIEKQLFR